MVIFLQGLPVYSSEEKAMMAEIPRDDQLQERRGKASNMVFIYNIMFIFLQNLPVYSSEEKAMMAEILRDDQLNERR